MQNYYTKIGEGGGIVHTFTLGEIAICVLLFIIVILLIALMDNKK